MASTLKNLPCPECLSSDNLKVFLNEQGKETSRCVTPDCPGKVDKLEVKVDNILNIDTHEQDLSVKVRSKDFLYGEIAELKKRSIIYETCRRLNYQVTKHNGEWVRILNWYENDQIIAQKIKRPNDPVTGKKRMYFINHNDRVGLYGKWLWSPNPNLFVTITEGEEDMMAVMQTQGYQYAVVSIPKGADDARKSIQEDIKWLSGFKYVILAFDNDEAGKKATRQCLDILDPGKVRVVEWPLKDANEMLMKGRADEIKNLLFRAKEIVPDKSVTVSNIMDRILKDPIVGTAFPWPTMTDITYGLQEGEMYVFSASPATGKTQIALELVNHFCSKENIKCGVFGLEQDVAGTIRRMAGLNLGLKLHLPGVVAPKEDLEKEAFRFEDKIYLYDQEGEIPEVDVFTYIRFWNKAKGVSLFVLDNLQMIDTSHDFDKLKSFMNKLKKTMKELKSTIIIISHVNVDGIKQSTHVGFSSKVENPHGNLTEASVRATMNKFRLDWPDGRMPETKNIEGGKYLNTKVDYIFVFGRDRNSENDRTKRITRCKCIKARRDSTKDGKEFMLYYNDQGQLEEIPVQQNQEVY